MNQNDMRSLARIMIIGIAIYIALGQFAAIVYLPVIFFENFKALPVWDTAVIVVMLGGFAAIVYVLIRYSDRIAERIVKPETESVIEGQAPCWLAAAFRMGSVLAGFVFLYKFITKVLAILPTLIRIWLGGEPPLRFNVHYHTQWQTYFTWAFLLIIGVYLLCGAPHFVRWHVRKTLELCGQNGDNDDSAGEESA